MATKEKKPRKGSVGKPDPADQQDPLDSFAPLDDEPAEVLDQDPFGDEDDEDEDDDTNPLVDQAQPAADPPAEPRREVVEAAARVPYSTGPINGYVGKHVEVQLDAKQAETLRRLYDACDEVGARLKSGKRVTSNADVLRYLLEAVGEDFHLNV